MKFLVVGLGNIGTQYANTRHNVGFQILDAFAEASNFIFITSRLGDIASHSIKGRRITFLKPNTYMNLSGKAVSYYLKQENIPLENLLVVYDDLALPFGKIRIRPTGSDGGHNGVKNINELLQTQQYGRLRFGIGSDFPKGRQVDYVLGNWSTDEETQLKEKYNLAQKAIESFVLAGIQNTMNQFNNL